MKKILVTGGAGYIGSYLSTELVRKGYDVTVVDKQKYSTTSLNHLYKYSNFQFYNQNINDLKFLKQIVSKFDFILPLAALVGAPLCDKNEKEAIKTNYGQIQFFTKHVKSNQKIIYLNTNSGYGVGEKNTLCTEQSPLKPISLYGKTKVDAEIEIIKKLKKNWISLRLATVFGYSYRMRTDLLVNFLVLEAVKRKHLKIFEPNYRRNYIHVSDVSNAIIFFIENFNKYKCNIYNLGLSEANYTKIKLARTIKKIVKNTKISVIKNKSDPDKRDYFVDNSKIEKTGFKTKVSIEKGISELYNVYKNIKNFDFKNNY